LIQGGLFYFSPVTGGHVLYRDDGAVRALVPRGKIRATVWKRRVVVGRPHVSWAWVDIYPILASLFDYLILLLNFLFLQ
jgi:hypothetical protein